MRNGRSKHNGGLARRKFLDSDELARFREFARLRAEKLKSQRAETDYLIVELLALSGLRAGELAATDRHPERYLRLRNLNLNATAPEIEVDDAKRDKSRIVPISSALANLLRGYVAKYRATAGPDAPLIEGCHGKPLRYRVLYDKLIRLEIEAGLRTERDAPDQRRHDRACHSLRHSYAVRYLEESGNDYKGLADVLGHSSAQITMDVYAGVTDKRRRAVAERMQ